METESEIIDKINKAKDEIQGVIKRYDVKIVGNYTERGISNVILRHEYYAFEGESCPIER